MRIFDKILHDFSVQTDSWTSLWQNFSDTLYILYIRVYVLRIYMCVYVYVLCIHIEKLKNNKRRKCILGDSEYQTKVSPISRNDPYADAVKSAIEFWYIFRASNPAGGIMQTASLNCSITKHVAWSRNCRCARVVWSRVDNDLGLRVIKNLNVDYTRIPGGKSWQTFERNFAERNIDGSESIVFNLFFCRLYTCCAALIPHRKFVRLHVALVRFLSARRNLRFDPLKNAL